MNSEVVCWVWKVDACLNIMTLYCCVSCWIPSRAAEIPSVNTRAFTSQYRFHLLSIPDMSTHVSVNVYVCIREPISRNIENLSEENTQKHQCCCHLWFLFPQIHSATARVRYLHNVTAATLCKEHLKGHRRANPLMPHKNRRELTLEFMKRFLRRDAVLQQQIDERFMFGENDALMKLPTGSVGSHCVLESLEAKMMFWVWSNECHISSRGDIPKTLKKHQSPTANRNQPNNMSSTALRHYLLAW